ncbi:hypothetical protein BKA80DRAFT_14071 [Phyllosticta citrichinensis]
MREDDETGCLDAFWKVSLHRRQSAVARSKNNTSPLTYLQATAPPEAVLLRHDPLDCRRIVAGQERIRQKLNAKTCILISLRYTVQMPPSQLFFAPRYFGTTISRPLFAPAAPTCTPGYLRLALAALAWPQSFQNMSTHHLISSSNVSPCVIHAFVLFRPLLTDRLSTK